MNFEPNIYMIIMYIIYVQVYTEGGHVVQMYMYYIQGYLEGVTVLVYIVPSPHN